MSKKKKSAGYMEATAVSLALQQSLMDHHDDSGIEEFSEVEVRHGRNWLPAGLMAHAVSGQPALTIAEPEPNKFAPEPKPARSKRHDKDYDEGRLGAS